MVEGLVIEPLDGQAEDSFDRDYLFVLTLKILLPKTSFQYRNPFDSRALTVKIYL
jgi:hypothetical protein